MLTVGLLGGVEVRRDGVRLDLPSGKTSELLARLAVEAGSAVRTDLLLEDLWSEPAGRNTLQSKVSQLRKALGDKDLVVAAGDGYLLDVPSSVVDANRAAVLAGSSAAAREAGDVATALERAREGLGLFRGGVLVEAGDWAAPHRTRLEELRLSILEAVMAARVDLGAGSELVAELESLVVEHPLREGLWASLMTALYRGGRQADALAAYARVRRHLVDGLGIEPGATLRALEQQVLQQSPALDGASQPPGVAAPGNLPVRSRAMVGRDEDLAAVTSGLGVGRMVTVAGPAGVGKTRLAVEVARDVHDRGTAPGGVWIVRLDAVEADASLVQVVAEALHVPVDESALRERLSGAGTLLVLDNCEHLVGSVAAFADTMLTAAPRLRVLATSQVPLGIEDEHVHQLDPLDHDASVALFTDRALELRRSLTLDADTTDLIGRLCLSLDGLPLAIELAASRARSLSVRDIARRLDDRFALLRDPSSNRPERRRTLDGAITWSYELLFPDDQVGLWALSCFSGSASLEATEHVLAALGVPSSAVVDTVTRLVDRSLVIVDSGEHGTVRYRMLDSIRSYAADRLLESGKHALAASAHADWYDEKSRWCDGHICTADQPQCLTVARTERANIDAALAWCAQHDPVRGGRIAVGFGWTWVVLGDGTAGAARVRGALTDALPPAQRATGLMLAAWLESSAGDVALAQQDLDAARRLVDPLGDELLAADVERHQAFVAIQQGRPDVVVVSATTALAVYRTRDLTWRIAGCLLLAAFGSLMLGDTAAATRDAREAVDLLTPIGDSWGLVHAQAMLGGIAQAEHRLADAAEALEQAADESATMGFVGQAALHRATLGRVQQRAGDPQAASTYQRAIDDAIACGDGRLAATARLNLARMRRIAGEHESAVALLEQNEEWYASTGGGDFALLTRCVLCCARDDRAGLEAVLQDAMDEENHEVELFALDGLARVAAEAGDPATSEELLARADSLAPGLSHLVDGADRVDAMVARRLRA